MPQLSIIVPCCNQRQTISALLESLENQSLDSREFEIIISDDGSTDESIPWLKRYPGPLNLIILENQHKGRAGTRNRALEKVQGKYILFLDGDMIAAPGLLSAHLSALKTSENTVYLGKVVPVPSQEKEHLAWYRATRGAQKVGPQNPVPPRYFATNNASLPARLLASAGLFNEAYTSWGGEDLEMGYRLAACGAQFRYLPNAVSRHDHPEMLEEYTRKIARYAETGLPVLMANCPAHAQTGYLRAFTSKAPLQQLLLTLLFTPVLDAAAQRAVCRFPFRNVAFRCLDYITYFRIYRGLKRSRHA